MPAKETEEQKKAREKREREEALRQQFMEEERVRQQAEQNAFLAEKERREREEKEREKEERERREKTERELEELRIEIERRDRERKEKEEKELEERIRKEREMQLLATSSSSVPPSNINYGFVSYGISVDPYEQKSDVFKERMVYLKSKISKDRLLQTARAVQNKMSMHYRINDGCEERLMAIALHCAINGPIGLGERSNRKPIIVKNFGAVKSIRDAVGPLITIDGSRLSNPLWKTIVLDLINVYGKDTIPDSVYGIRFAHGDRRVFWPETDVEFMSTYEQ